MKFSAFGFGLEKLGLWALRAPRLFAIALVVLTLAAAYFVTKIEFRGSITGVLPHNGKEFLNYEAQKKEFRNFSRDVAVIVRSPRLLTPDGMSDLRDLQLDLALEDGVLSAVSILSLPNFNDESGQFESFFPADMSGLQTLSAEYERIFDQFPQARSLLSEEINAAIVLVALDLPLDDDNDERVFEIYGDLISAVNELAPADFEIHYSGLTPISLTILQTLKQDQALLTLACLVLGAIVAGVLFGNVFAGLFCSVPALLAALWGLGFLGAANVPVTYMTTVLPTIALVLAYADGIVLYHGWLSKNRAGGNVAENLAASVQEVGPAAALTSLTTALALGSFALSNSEALQEFAWLGLVLVSLAYVSVIVTIPVLGILLTKAGFKFSGRSTLPGSSVGKWFTGLYDSFRLPIVAGGVLLCLVLFASHSLLAPDYKVTELLTYSSETRKAEEMSNKYFGGRSLVFVTFPTVSSEGIADEANQERLLEVDGRLRKHFGVERVYSIAALFEGHSEEARTKITGSLSQAPEFTKQGYISRSGDRMLVSVRLPSSQSIKQTRDLVGELKEQFAGLAFADQIVVTGFPVLLATEFYDLINLLRNNLLLAALFGVILIGIVTRSVFFAMAVFVPNFLPILFVEGFLFVTSGTIGITDVIALTIGLGIAIDNTIHIINAYRLQPADKTDERTRLRNAITEIAPALTASCLIISIGVAVGLLSSLPIIVKVSVLIVATIVVALISNLLTLPAYILTLSRGQSSSHGISQE